MKSELEKFYAYARYLLKKLPGPNRGPRYDLGDDVALEYYRLQKMAEGGIGLQKDSGAAIKPMSEAGTKKDKDELARSSPAPQFAYAAEDQGWHAIWHHRNNSAPPIMSYGDYNLGKKARHHPSPARAI